MTRSPTVRHATRLAGIVLLLVAFLPRPLAAQARPDPVAEFSAGWVGFPDDSEIVGEAMVGGAARWYLSPRVGIGLELLWINGTNHRHFVLTGNATFDLLHPDASRNFTPFIVVGGGMFQTNETFFNGDFTSTEGAFTAGGGLRARAGDRIIYGIDARIGWELHVRVNGFIGVRLGH